MATIKVFKYIVPLDCFVIHPDYKKIADKLGLTEWSEVVWIGRYFCLDNDNGEHWFDNWSERENLTEKAKGLGWDPEDLFIIDPSRFKNGMDGPCHTDDERRKFWTDVLKSLELSIDTLVSEARKFNNGRTETDSSFIVDLEFRIKEVKGAH
jgi:hypothetical protein